MYLKSIEMYGFKSFAERTKIELDESITCIVGPNGSGKSNITDAIKWVLGEQSSRTLRGDKMEDVIFSGTNSRRSLGLAEVIITFDNSSSTLDLDYTEIQVKRRLYKNGDSEYYINNNSCRLKDVRELFMDTGIGRDGYSIIGQGRIDEILSNKPEDRRAIFEEASGISKYKFQKLETEKKLNKTNENLIRLKDIITELKSQESGLRAEAKQAEEYNEIYNELKSYDIFSNTRDVIKLTEIISDNKELLSKLSNDKDETKLRITDLEEKFNRSKEDLDSIELEINELQITNIENVKHEKDIKSKIDVYEERLNSKENELITLEERINNLINSRLRLVDNIEHKTSEIKNSEDELSDIKNSFKVIEAKLAESEELEKDYLNKINDNDVTINKLTENNRANSLSFERMASLNDERQKRILQLKEDIIELNGNYAKLEHTVNEIKEEKTGNLSKLKELSDSLSSSEIKYGELTNEINNLRERAYSTGGRVSNLESRIKILVAMEESYEGYNKSIKDYFSYLNKNRLIIDGQHDTIANLINVDTKYEKALTSALGANTQSLVVDDTKTAEHIIEILRKNKFGRMTFLPLSNMKPRIVNYHVKNNGFIDYACNLIGYDKKYENIIKSVLGNVLVVSNMNTADAISKELGQKARIVTLEGDVINPGGAITGGSMKMGGNVLHRKNEIISFKDELKRSNIELESINKAIDAKNSELVEIRDTNKNLDREKSLIKIRIDQNELDLIEAITNLKHYESQLKLSNDQLEKFETESESFKEEVVNKQQLDDEYNMSFDNLMIEKNRLQSEYKAFQLKLEEFKLKYESYKVKISGEEKSLQTLISGKSTYEAELLEIEDQINLSTNKKIVINEENKGIRESLAKDKITLQETISSNSGFKEKNEKLLIKKRDILTSYETGSRMITESNTELLRIEKELYSIDTSIKRDELRLNSILEYISENYYFTLIYDLLLEIELTKPSYSMTIKEMKQKLSLMGNVNHSAIIQYKNLKERLSFNETQYNDLMESKIKLEDMLDEIQLIMKEKFLESFHTINKNFKEIFSIMFSGGTAEVVMSESENILESGIDIITQPPGKKRQNLNLMSGGERSLTAVSLLFALLKTKPAPFCLLDEIDAALDDANIKRFVSYLKTLDDIQFAIITHRKPTMEVADYIYGITMEETGVSKVVSIKFNERKGLNV